jgi:TPR repeat protein
LAPPFGLGGLPQNVSEAAKWYHKSASQGNADAQLSISLMYLNGEGVPVDDAETLKWCRKSAEQGNVQAQGFLNSEGKFQELLECMNRH